MCAEKSATTSPPPRAIIAAIRSRDMVRTTGSSRATRRSVSSGASARRYGVCSGGSRWSGGRRPVNATLGITVCFTVVKFRQSAAAAALLARAGARGFAEPLEGKGGFFAVYGGGPPTERLVEALGTRFLGDEVSLKPWPSCRGTHGYVEAALVLRPRTAGRRIVRIEAETGLIQEMLIRPQPAKAAPASAIQAKFSIPFTVAHALVHGDLTLDSFDAASRDEPAVLALAAHVVERRNPDWGRAHAACGALSIVPEDGERLHHEVLVPQGSPARPLSESDLVEKFVRCAAKAAEPLDTRQAERIARRILQAAPEMPARSLLDPADC